MLQWLRAQPEVLAAQYNHRLQHRGHPVLTAPNDSLYAQQWHHRNPSGSAADLASEQAWSITTGGLTPPGDTIVIAIIDSGVDALHEDLAPNLWRNWAEIPNDGIDNDQNGYVDDFRGWNAFAQNDQIGGVATSHGTAVSAMAGARGNNEKGIAGVNWAVKLLFVAGNGTEDVILAAFDYVLRARRRYQATGGQQGAFVVAINCSWGIDGGKPSDAPLWCAAFDSLGTAGILSVAATANLAVNVDTFGDLPTTCPSDYLISVTSLTRQNAKAADAAWGASSIDLGAYGEGIFTARPNNNYGVASGTSFAAPLVAGAIALLYAAPCGNLALMARAHPAAAALWVKEHLLSNTAPTAVLQGITVSGGRLHLFRLLQAYEDQCGACIAPFGVEAIPISRDSILIEWASVHSAASTAIRWREKGTLAWELAKVDGNNFTVGGLKPCTAYEFSLQTLCAPDTVSPWIAPVTTTTLGCCSAPQNLRVENISSTQVLLAWHPIEGASSYLVQLYHPNGLAQALMSTKEQAVLSDLSPCQTYEVSVSAFCEPDQHSASTALTFTTLGCGPCLDLAYCAAGAANAQQEWIALIQIGNWSSTPPPAHGYFDITSSGDDIPVLVRGDTLPIVLKPGYSAQTYRERFRVYVDYNGDGDFLAPGELAFEPGFAVEEAIQGVVAVPTNASVGLTRLRVLMKYFGANSSPPHPCEAFEFGQVVDLCARVEDKVQVNETSPAPRLRLFPNPAHHRLWVLWEGDTAERVHLRLFDVSGRLAWEYPLLLTAAEALALDLPVSLQGLFFVEKKTASGTSWERVWIQRP